jgi:acyl transferase domain-containing protein
VFVFPGPGSQGMDIAVELLDTAPAFADQMRRCDAAFAEFLDWSLLGAVRGGGGSAGLERVDVAQPVLFAVMVSLAALWRARGVQPDASWAIRTARSRPPTSPAPCRCQTRRR